MITDDVRPVRCGSGNEKSGQGNRNCLFDVGLVDLDPVGKCNEAVKDLEAGVPLPCLSKDAIGISGNTASTSTTISTIDSSMRNTKDSVTGDSAHDARRLRSPGAQTETTSSSGGGSIASSGGSRSGSSSSSSATTIAKSHTHDIFPVLVEKSAQGYDGSFSRVDSIDECTRESDSLGPKDIEDLISKDSIKSSSSASSSDLASEKSDGDDLGQKESKTVLHLRVLLLVFLALAAFGVALSVYFYTSKMEQKNFEKAFEDHAAKVLDALGGSLDLTLGAIDSYVIGLVSFARHASDMDWPFVTLPDQAVRWAKIRTLSKAVAINQYHVVTKEQRLKWENYSIHNDGWVREGLEVQKQDRNYHGVHLDEYFALGTLYDNSGETLSYDLEGPFFPKWQNYPVVPVWPPYNWDGTVYPQLINNLPELLSQKAVFSEALNLPKDPTDPHQVAFADHNNNWVKEFLGPEEKFDEPFSDLLYPIMDCAADVVSLTLHEKGRDGDQAANCSLVGIVGVVFFWRDLIRDILSPGTQGMVGVFESSCDQTFSHQINGPHVEYLGPGDLHDTRFGHMKRTAYLHDLEAYSTRDRDYTGLPIGNETCSYQLHLYPSAEMLKVHTTNNPLVFTIVALLIFSFTSVIFLLYDWYVERRQVRVMQTAVESKDNVIVLEDVVRERTKKLRATNMQLEKANETITVAAARQLQHFACMSHEIRTPLNCIIGLSSLMQQSRLEKKQRESMKMIVNSGELLLRVVNDVLDYSKLEAGKVVVELQQCSLQESLNAVVRSIETSAHPQQIRMETHYDATIGETFVTDSRRLQQILYNCLGNAIKFSRPGGVVELRVQHCSKSGDGWDSDRDELPGILRFVVKDYGKGIEKKDFEKIFEPFQQASSETERIYGGSGLGLAITAKLVQALGGSISVNSEVGLWTEMFVDFPYSEEETPMADIPAISTKLEGSAIYLVGDSHERDVSETVRVCKQHGVSAGVHPTMGALEEYLKKSTEANKNTKASIFLVREDLYDHSIYQLLSTKFKSALLTFGPKFLVQDVWAHYRSLTNVLPSVLMREIADHYTAAANQLPKKSSQVDLIAAGCSYQDYRVLIAEDNLVNQKVLVRILKKLGITNVVVVDNGQKAVDKEKDEKFEVVLMDMQMPVMDGIDACQLITDRQKRLKLKPLEGSKVVFVTAHALDHFKEKCQAAGGAGFLSKPFRLKDVEDCFVWLQALLDGSHSDSWYECSQNIPST